MPCPWRLLNPELIHGAKRIRVFVLEYLPLFQIGSAAIVRKTEAIGSQGGASHAGCRPDCLDSEIISQFKNNFCNGLQRLAKRNTPHRYSVPSPVAADRLDQFLPDARTRNASSSLTGSASSKRTFRFLSMCSIICSRYTASRQTRTTRAM